MKRILAVKMLDLLFVKHDFIIKTIKICSDNGKL